MATTASETRGGLTQLIRTGTEDTHLSADPETTLFREERKRVAKYVHVWSEITNWRETGTAGDGSIEFTIPREADLLNSIQFEAQVELDYLPYLFPGVPDCFAATTSKRRVFFAALSVLYEQHEFFERRRSAYKEARSIQLDQARLTIGGARISTLYGGYERFKGNHPEVIAHEGLYDPKTRTTSEPGSLVRIRLDFGLSGSRALPLVALHFHDVCVQIKLRAGSAAPFIKHQRLLVSYILLSDTEVSEMATSEHGYVLEHTLSSPQRGVFESEEHPGWLSFRLSASHPTISIAFRVRDAFGASLPLEYIQFYINDRVRIQAHGFELLCHSAGDEPRLHGPFRKFSPDAMYVLQFSLPNPRATCGELEPHGTVNLSQIDRIRLDVKVNGLRRDEEYSLEHYQRCTNRLRILRGTGGLSYA